MRNRFSISLQYKSIVEFDRSGKNKEIGISCLDISVTDVSERH